MKPQFVELCARADIGQKRRDVDGGVALARDLDMIDPRLVADHQLKHGVDLIIRFIAPLMGLDEGRAGAAADHHQRSRDHRSRRRAGIDENQMDRPLDRDAGRNRDDDAVAGQRGVERERRIVGGNHRAEPLRQQRLVQGQRLGHRANEETGFETGEIGQLGDERAVDDHQAPEAESGQQAACVSRALLGFRIGRRRKRLGIPHQPPQVGIFPGFDPGMRQPGKHKMIECGGAHRGDIAAAGQALPRRRVDIDQTEFGLGPDGADASVHDRHAASF